MYCLYRFYLLYLRCKIKHMRKILTRLDDTELDVRTLMVECPGCGKKILDVQYVNGVVMLRVKCPRCKHFIKINMTE